VIVGRVWKKEMKLPRRYWQRWLRRVGIRRRESGELISPQKASELEEGENENFLRLVKPIRRNKALQEAVKGLRGPTAH